MVDDIVSQLWNNAPILIFILKKTISLYLSLVSLHPISSSHIFIKRIPRRSDVTAAKFELASLRMRSELWIVLLVEYFELTAYAYGCSLYTRVVVGVGILSSKFSKPYTENTPSSVRCLLLVGHLLSSFGLA